MKREAFDHPKIRRLARLLDEPLYAARGIVESLWHVTAKFAPRGNIGRLEDEDIADQIDWRKDPAALMESLVKAKLVDACETHRYVIHDWADHADNGVKARLRRMGDDFARPGNGRAAPPSTSATDAVTAALEARLGRDASTSDLRRIADLVQRLESDPLEADGKTHPAEDVLVLAINAMPPDVRSWHSYVSAVIEDCRADNVLPAKTPKKEASKDGKRSKRNVDTDFTGVGEARKL